jgi:integrase
MIPADRMKGRKPHTYYLKSAQMQLIARNAAGWKTDINKSNAARWLYYQTIKKLGFTKSGPHALRRHVGTEIAEKFGIEAARIHLGHADIKTTAGYVKVRQEMREEVAQSIADSINFG